MSTHLEEFPIGDVTIVIHIVYAKCEAQLRQLVALHTELRDALDELLEVHFTVAIRIEYIDNSLHQRILL